MMEREGKTLRSYDQPELKCEGRADNVTYCAVVEMLVSDKFVLLKRKFSFTFKGLETFKLTFKNDFSLPV